MTIKNKFPLIYLAAALYVQTTVHAESTTVGKTYVAANYGVGIANKFNYDEYLKITRPKNSQIFGMAVGYQFNDNIRAELAFNHFHKFKYSNTIPNALADPENKHPNATHSEAQDIKVNALFANLYFDINQFNKFIPHVNAGIGIAKNSTGTISHTVKQSNIPDLVNETHGSKTQNRFAWNFGAGVAYKLNDTFTLDLINYKYYSLGEVSTGSDIAGDPSKTKLKVQSISTGIRIKF